MIRLIDERVMEMVRDKTEEIDLEELIPLVVEWSEGRASKAKCPYCVKPIEKQATKCNHCLSEIEWFKFNGLYGPCKIGEAEEMERPLAIARATVQVAAENKRAALENKIKELKKAVCPKCSKPIFARWEIEQASRLTVSKLKKFEEGHRINPDGEFKCRECGSKVGIGYFLLFFIGIPLAILVIAIVNALISK
jgi:DNA-directed RNA polymerase subunit RPC12/RpoP